MYIAVKNIQIIKKKLYYIIEIKKFYFSDKKNNTLETSNLFIFILKLSILQYFNRKENFLYTEIYNLKKFKLFGNIKVEFSILDN